MNHQTWSKKKFWAILIAVFFVGAMIASSGAQADQPAKVETWTVTKEVKVTDTNSIKQLNTLDQQMFADSAEVIGLQSEALSLAATALTNYNSMSIADANAMTASVDAKTAR